MTASKEKFQELAEESPEKAVRALNPERINRPVYRRKGRYTGKQTGMSFSHFLETVLKANEAFPKKDKLTDESIKLLLIKEFEGTPIAAKLQSGQKTVAYFRAQYNYGRLTGRKPRKKSYAYDHQGNRLYCRRGPYSPKGGRRKSSEASKNKASRKNRKGK